MKPDQGFRCEDLTRQTFRSELFDLVITQDVLEHIFEPILALKDICRTLKPGGAHVFTVPWYYWSETKVRARKIKGEVEYLEEPDYHRNPIDENGALVVTEWGKDLLDVIYENTEMETTVVKEINRDMGIDAEFIEIFISRKPN
jgi:2-polyprenyl-3-methyl-5-hydroxy-6-metoxy-1,4-benzoquinol methylase